MVRTPGFLADQVMKSAHAATLVSRRDLGHGLLELVLGSDDFRGATFVPGDSTAFRTGRTEFRHYTPARLDAERGEMSIIVHKHGSGPGEELILGWSDGDPVAVCQWGSKKNFRWEDGSTPVMVVGDATVISLVMAFGDRCAAEGRPFSALLEVEPGDVEATLGLVPGTTVVARDGAHGLEAEAWLQRHAGEIDSTTTVYLAGHGQSIQRQRRVLLDLTPIDRRGIRTQPYWADGKTGL
ncbi:hypothetical protein [Aeromicrobium sp. Leaf350]|uniref:hypothetical protein n=1 Tax=Aeromicrobium sp. Leaf350 TaxID=2876565 RepID=UPI001E537DAE|nr:hypothetical protein [Aeromicrobium sp. Leaf350]